MIDPQTIFASPDSAWGSPFFAAAMPRIRALAESFGERVIVTRWMPTADRSTSWGAYFAAWPFADRPPTDPLYDLVPTRSVSRHPPLDLPTFGKWGPDFEASSGAAPLRAGGGLDGLLRASPRPWPPRMPERDRLGLPRRRAPVRPDDDHREGPST